MLFRQERALGEASVQDDADACAAITDLILGEDCEAVLTTSPDLSSGAIDAVNAGAGNTVTLSVTNSDIKPGQYMRLLDVPSQNCEARPMGSNHCGMAGGTDALNCVRCGHGPQEHEDLGAWADGRWGRRHRAQSTQPQHRRR